MKKIIQKTKLFAFISITAAIAITGCIKDHNNDYPHNPPQVKAVVFSAASDGEGIASTLDEFKNALGTTLNTAPGAIGGRREVNWDAVPASFTNANNFPPDFFGQSDPALPAGRKRGLLLASAGTSFRVDSTSYLEVDASYNSEFKFFSKVRLFVSLGSTVTECTFKVPGTTTDAFVKGFGVVFNDVDIANSTSIEYFNGSKSLGVYYAKPSASRQFSLLGVIFPDEKVTKVKITSGKGLLASGVKDITAGGSNDLVVMDDFLYSEPVSQ